MEQLREALHHAVDRVADYQTAPADSRVTPVLSRAALREVMDTTLREGPTPVEEVIDELVRTAAPGLMRSTGPRYFGFVVGGALPAALTADVIATGWDQIAFNEATSPAALAFEDVAGGWLKELLGVPSHASVGFVTGAQGANTVGLAAGRWKVLHDHGWDVGRQGLFGAPPVRVVVGAERHATVDRALRLLGLGEGSMVVVPARADGAMDETRLPDVLAGLEGPVIVVAQAGNVNTGAFDDLRVIGELAGERQAWLHVDGAFGLWAGASPRYSHLTDGLELASSWGCDGHKWLNVPYDSGYAFCSAPEVHATAMAYTAEYLTGQVAGREFGGGDYVLESSRRARAFATWAAIRSLGRSGVAELVDHCCLLARRLAEGVSRLAGVEVVNDVVLNQVLIDVGDDEATTAIERWIQEEGVVWLGGTTWRGKRLLRVSVSNWSTSEVDIDACTDAIARAVAAVQPR